MFLIRTEVEGSVHDLGFRAEEFRPGEARTELQQQQETALLQATLREVRLRNNLPLPSFHCALA